MLDLGRTSFAISPEAAKGFPIPDVKWVIPGRASDFGCRKLNIAGLFSIPLVLSFGQHRILDEQDHTWEVIKTSSEYDALIPARYLNKHKDQGITPGHLHFPFCSTARIGHGTLHPE
jgi:hypothetical protein